MFADLFRIHVSVPELMLRGTLVYWLLFLIFRFILRRDVGAVGIADILLLVIVVNAAHRYVVVSIRGRAAVRVATMDELNEKLREPGIERMSDVRAA
ncbi:MAG: hypothetical protein ABI821_05030 [Pseudomonadota bacterium]